MFDLNGLPTLVLSVTLAVALPALIVVLWSRRRTTASGAHHPALRVAGRASLVVLAQLTAVSALFLLVNNQYGFYSSWADLLGQGGGAPSAIQVSHVNPGDGTAEVLAVTSKSGVTADALVWLPPGYNDSGQTYPVVMFLPGQPATPMHVFQEYDFGNAASQAIASGRIKPFVAVFPPIMIAPPRDTECVDIPNGPQAETWLTTDVPNALQATYRVEPLGKHWSLMGWSTGGLCAAKLLLKYPASYSAAVSFGGDFQAYVDSTTGDLFAGDPKLRDENSPLWLYGQYGMRGGSLLIVAGQQDPWAWKPAEQMSFAARGDSSVTLISFPTGGHNYRNYKTYVPSALDWLAKTGATG